MFTGLEEVFSSLQQNWDISEGEEVFTLRGEQCSEDECALVIDQVANLREYFDGRSLLFGIEESRDNFDYTLQWEPRGTVICSENVETGSPSNRIFTESEAASALDDIRNDRITDREGLERCLRIFTNEDLVEVSFRFPVPKSAVEGYTEDALGIEFDVTFYYSIESLFSDIRELEVEEVKEFFAPTDSKHLFVIFDKCGHAFGDELGFFSLEALEGTTFDDYHERTSKLSDKLNVVGRECAIDGFEEMFVPPSLFELVSFSDPEFSQRYNGLVARFQVMFFLIGISNVARMEGDAWIIRIQGRRVLESSLQLTEVNDGFRIEFQNGSSTDSTIINQELAASAVEIFEWVYQSRVTDRIMVFRNIVTLYTTSIGGFLEQIDEIFDSTKDNLKFYVEESIDEFMDFQQEVSNYALQTQSELSSLRRDLMNNLIRDIYRIFGFVIVSWVAIFLQISDLANIRTALSVSLAPVFIYLLLGFRSVQGLDQQYKSIEATKSRYYKFFQKRIDENILSDIIDESAEEKIQRRIRTDLRIYYATITVLIALTVLVWIYLLIYNGPLPDFLRNLSTNM